MKQIKQSGMRRLELAELRDMPGALVDPFRAVEVLPGIVPFLSGCRISTRAASIQSS